MNTKPVDSLEAAAETTVPVSNAGAPTASPQSERSTKATLTARERWLRLPLTRQLVLLAVLPALLAMLGTAGILSRQYLEGVTDLVRNNAHSIAQQLATTALNPLEQLDRRALNRVVQSGVQHRNVHNVQILSTDGEILATAEEPEPTSDPLFQVTVPVADESKRELGRLRLEMSMKELTAARRAMWFNLAAILAACVLSVMLVGLWAAKRINAPIRQLSEAMDRLSAGEEVQVPQHGSPEMQHLQYGLNRAARSLSENQRNLKIRIEQATTELARKNQQLEVASHAKTRLLAAASHDLRQPLHALTLFSDSLADGESDPARLARIGHIRACVESLDRLFSELLNLSQLDAGVLHPQWTDFPLDQLFDDVSRNFRPVAEKQELRLVVRKTEVWVRSDYVMLTRILSNLISNALRHTETGGVLVGARLRGRQVRIEVWDTGVGIAPEHESRIFEEFYQVDPQRAQAAHGTQGMGLGLATVQRLTKLLNIRVDVRSRIGFGTCMSVTSRVVEPRETFPHLLQAPEDTRLDGLTILVIDDERTILEGLNVVLTYWGAKVLTAQSHAEVIALADQWRTPPDVVVSDLLLQGPDNGLELLTALASHPRGTTPQTAQLLVTGETSTDQLREATARGIPVLHKPVAPLLLRQTILAQIKAVRRVA